MPRRWSAIAARGLQGAGQEGLDLVRGRCVALEEVAALGDEGRAWWRGRRRAGSWVGIFSINGTFLPRYLHGREFRPGVSRAAVPLIGKNHLGVGVGGESIHGITRMKGGNIKQIMFHTMAGADVKKILLS